MNEKNIADVATFILNEQQKRGWSNGFMDNGLAPIYVRYYINHDIKCWILLFTQMILLIPKWKEQNAPAWVNSRSMS